MARRKESDLATPENCDRLGKECRHGHLLTPETLYRAGNGYWQCDVCRKEREGLTYKGRKELRERQKLEAQERADKSAGMTKARKNAMKVGGARIVNTGSALEALEVLEEAKGDPDYGKPLPTGVISQRVDDLLRDVNSALTSAKIALSTPRDLVWMLGVLIDKRQILKGEPTQRVSHEVRLKLDELGPLIFEEIERRKTKARPGLDPGVIEHE